MKHQNISLIIFGKENTVTLESARGTLCVFFLRVWFQNIVSSPTAMEDHWEFWGGEWPHCHQQWSGHIANHFYQITKGLIFSWVGADDSVWCVLADSALLVCVSRYCPWHSQSRWTMPDSRVCSWKSTRVASYSG